MPQVSTITYSSNIAIALDLSSLGASASFLSGMESTQIDNTADQYDQALVNIDPITCGASVNVVGQELRVYLWGSDVSLATTSIDTLVGSTASRTLSQTNFLNSLRPVGASSATVVTAALKHKIMPFEVSSFFGFVMPKFWGLFVPHNFGGALGASNNSLFRFTGIKHTFT